MDWCRAEALHTVFRGREVTRVLYARGRVTATRHVFRRAILDESRRN